MYPCDRSVAFRLRAVLVLSVLLVGAGCAVNPATGRRQLMLVSEAQEIELGRRSDPQIVEQFGLYDDAELQQWVAGLGARLAADSERPELPWTFRVLDDPLVNAFALPGGFVYVTRGILAHFNSEAELVSVLGHEIGHVTARHSANQMSKSQLAQLGLGVGAAVTPESMQGVLGLVEGATALAFLKFGRDDERQADDLGLRYMVANGYDPREMVHVFEMLARVSGDPGDRGPTWASTHPAPEDREERITRRIAALGVKPERRRVDAAGYLERLDGIVFGQDPRQGYFRDELFLHPELRFSIRFPAGWKLQNQRDAVLGVTGTKDAMLRLALASEANAGEALEAFFDRNDVQRGTAWSPALAGMTAQGSAFALQRADGSLRGEVVCVEYDGRVFRLLGVASGERWDAYAPLVREAMASFRRVTDPKVLGVRPARVKIVRPSESMSVQELGRRYDAGIDAATLAEINNVDPGTRLEPGRPYKVVQGGELP